MKDPATFRVTPPRRLGPSPPYRARAPQLGGTATSHDLVTLAKQLCVDPRVVEYQIENHRLAAFEAD